MDKEREPGTARFGNFINYYSFNPPERRLCLLPSAEFFAETLRGDGSTPRDRMRVLDVGCNAGDLTVAAFEHFTGASKAKMESSENQDPSNVVEAHPSDTNLPKCANDQRENTASQQAPENSHSQQATENSHSQKAPENSHSQEAPENSHSQQLPENSPSQQLPENSHSQQLPKDSHSHRPLDIHMLGVDIDEKLIERCNNMNPHPENLIFKVADMLSDGDRETVVASYLHCEGVGRFDLILCFSVTLWIHLNHGDAGLRDFLRYISRRTCYLLIEPQPWKCYRTATRRMKRSKCEPFKHFPSLTWRDSVDEDILKFLTNDCGMELVETYGRTDWDRKVCLLKNISRT